MDLASTFSGIQQANIRSDISTAVAVKVMDNTRAEGAGVLQLLKAAAGGAAGPGDAETAAATGVGGQVDAYA